MRRIRILAAAGVLTLALAPNLMAQGGGFAIIPFAGYGIPGMLAEDDAADIHFEAQAALLLGAAIELSLNKNMSIDLAYNQTLSQILEGSGTGLAGSTEDDLTMAQITGALIIRPAGRKPNGGVTPFYIELGGGVTMYSLGSAASSTGDFDSTQPMGFAGVGYNLPIGPRATIQLFGRAQFIGPYSSAGLDAFNQLPPPTNVEGSMMMNFQIGAGLRVGR